MTSSTTTTTTDAIRKSIVLRAPRARVWRALTDATEFGTWFRVTLDDPFVEGATVRGHVTYPGYEHLTFEILVERIDPQTRFSYRWHPAATDATVDYSGEPTTLVEFLLEDAPEGTRLTITESGFDRLPASRRDDAFRVNDGGWTVQLQNITDYVQAT